MDLTQKTIAILGYGSQGSAQAQNLRDSGFNVIIGTRAGKSHENALQKEFSVYTLEEACTKADIIHILLPDEKQGEIYAQSIQQHIKGKTLSFSHGFSIVFKTIIAPNECDVIMIAPKAPGNEVRSRFLSKEYVAGLVAIQKDYSGHAKETAYTLSKGIGIDPTKTIECSFKEEAHEDLFGEQTVICGGVVELMKTGFETLVEAGYPPEMAYYECVAEMKLIVDLIVNKGFSEMASTISNTAEYGMWSTGPKIIDHSVKERMKEALKNIENGSFAKEWIASDKKFLLNKRKEISEHMIEKTGKKIRG